jgi:pyruvate,water dikinase
MQPKDPYEFIDLLTSGPMKSLERNKLLQNLALKVGKSPEVKTVEDFRKNTQLMKEIDAFVMSFSELSHNFMRDENERGDLMELLIEMASRPYKKLASDNKNVKSLAMKFIESFPDEDRDYADGLLQLGRKSYRLRDDDNIYLGRIESQLNRAALEGRKRLGQQCDEPRACLNVEEVITALKHKEYVPKKEMEHVKETKPGSVRARQLQGQPAGQGIARGKAHVVTNTSDLFGFKSGEILVCDAIDPNMTFIVPLAGAIVERRGGMLIHGAIIAREYGLPCVTGVPDAASLIHTGDFITVDGYYGLVTIHTGTYGEDG